MFAVLLALGWMLLPCAAAENSVEKVIGTGEDSSRFVWVILAEGYTEEEQEKFRTDVAQLTQAFFAVSPWQEYKQAINLYSLFTPSEASGADHPSEGRYVETAFDATYDTYGIARLLTVDEVKAFEVAQSVPHFDIVFVLVNDPGYGGSGGSVIVVSTHEAAAQIALHEAGHVVGKLADEYETPYPGYPEEIWEPNVTFETEIERVPWKAWISTETPLPTPESVTGVIGGYEGARVKPIEKFGPADARLTLVPGSGINLWVEPLPIAGAFEALWEIDDELLEYASETRLTLYPSSFTQGDHAVSVWIGDATDMVKNDTQALLTSTHSWSIAKGFCSGRLSGRIADSKTGRPVANAQLMLVDTPVSLRSDTGGAYDIPDTDCAEYTVAVEADGFRPTSEKVAVSDGKHSVLDVQLEPHEGLYYINGTITGDLPTAVTVMLSGDITATTTTDTNMDFVFGPLKPGNYIVQPAAAGYAFLPALQTVVIQDKNLTGIEFAASRMLTQLRVAGVVKGDIRQNIFITATGTQTATTMTDAQGNFRFDGLPAGRYVLTPRYPGTLFEPAQQNIELTQDKVVTILFWAKESLCPAAFLLAGRSADLHLLRQLRDTRLKPSSKGTFYIETYYMVGPEIEKLLQRNTMLRQEALQVYEQCLPILRMLLQGNNPVMPAATKAEIKAFAGHLAQHASPMLQKLIAHFIKDLDQGVLFSLGR